MITVVLADRMGGHDLEACLAILDPQIRDVGGQLIVATSMAPPPTGPRRKVLEAHPETLVPGLWGLGIECARGEWVALTASDCRPAPDWVESIARAFATEPSCAAFGGPIDPPSEGRPTDWALYFARYHAFLPPASGDGVRDLPGENVAYRRTALERAWEDRDNGFWEAFVHRKLREQGESLRYRLDLKVRLGRSGGLVRRARERFRHGSNYGARRPSRARWERWARAITAPLLPALLLARIGRRVMTRRRDLAPRFVVAIPALLVLLLGWALGEARGYLFGEAIRPSASDPRARW